MVQKQKNRWLRIAVTIIPLIFVLTLIGVIIAHNRDNKQSSSTASLNNAHTGNKTNNPNASAQTTDPGFDSKKYSIDTPTSPWVIVNKKRPLNPKTYAPDLATPAVPLRLNASSSEMQVSKQMAPALEKLVKASQAAGVPLMLASGYRSYDLQVGVYGAEVKNYGQATADRESARPGYSEHQTGLAADLEPTSRKCEIAQCFGQTPEGKWLAANAATYGFIIRYPEGKESVTGYMYEPWHIRYLGVDTGLAQELKKRNIDTLETFFNLSAAPNY